MGGNWILPQFLYLANFTESNGLFTQNNWSSTRVDTGAMGAFVRRLLGRFR